MSGHAYLSFQLDASVVEDLKGRPSPFPNLLAELTFIDKYSRKIDPEDPFSPKERFWQVIQRVTEGTYSILKDWCTERRIPWSEEKAQRSAAEFAVRAFEGKWSPPGRGYQMMGSRFVHEGRNSAPLQNCAFSSTYDESKGTDLFDSLAFTMEGAMLGIGPGFDTSAAGKYFWTTEDPNAEVEQWQIPDTREGWVDSTIMLLKRLVQTCDGGGKKQPRLEFDYSQIRPYGAPIRTFGGTAAGPQPLIDLHRTLRDLAKQRDGLVLETEDVADLGNLVGKCVVMGNIRRTAEILLGAFDDVKDLKDYRWDNDTQAYVGPKAHRGEWGHLSNNSAVVNVGDDIPYEEVVDYNFARSEPGLVFLDLIQSHGRLGDPADHADFRARGVNPCGEQALESFECCTLVETYPTRCEDKDDYLRTLKFAYLYAKAVTLLPTHWDETNAVMQRNRRIGTSMTGVAAFSEKHGAPVLKQWQDDGYDAITDWDHVYSEWLCCRESIRKTSVKPSGTVSKVWGVTPGVHWNVASHWIQRLRFPEDSPLVLLAEKSGYYVSKDVAQPNTVILHIPMSSDASRAQHEVSVWEKMTLAVATQRHWADNQVSCTLTFTENEKKDLANVLRAFEGQYKAISMQPISSDISVSTVKEGETPQEAFARLDQTEVGGYVQVPMHPIDQRTFEFLASGLDPVDFTSIYEGEVRTEEAEDEKYCTTDSCEIPV